MRIPLLVAAVSLLVVAGSGTPAFSTRPIINKYYVVADEFVKTAEQELSLATADEIKRVLDKKEPTPLGDMPVSKTPNSLVYLVNSPLFFSEYLQTFIQRDEFTKIKQFLQVVNKKKLVYGWGWGQVPAGCHNVDFAIKTLYDSDDSEDIGLYLRATQIRHAGGLCEWPEESKTAIGHSRILLSREHIDKSDWAKSKKEAAEKLEQADVLDRQAEELDQQARQAKQQGKQLKQVENLKLQEYNDEEERLSKLSEALTKQADDLKKEGKFLEASKKLQQATEITQQKEDLPMPNISFRGASKENWAISRQQEANALRQQARQLRLEAGQKGGY
jgi:flagellar biosynthesis GTPase FlhF